MPKISQDRIPQRFVDRRCPQRAEQLVEVPTVVSHSSLQQQSAEQARTWTFQFLALVVIMEVCKVFHPRQGSLQRTVEQIVDIPVPSGPQGFLRDPGLAAPAAVSRDELGQVFCFFAFFPPTEKKCGARRAGGVRGCTGTRAHPRGALIKCLLVTTSGFRSTPTTIARTAGTDRSGRPIGRCRQACVRAG